MIVNIKHFLALGMIFTTSSKVLSCEKEVDLPPASRPQLIATPSIIVSTPTKPEEVRVLPGSPVTSPQAYELVTRALAASGSVVQ